MGKAQVFVSPQRRRASHSGHGVQYLPGHVEPFVDLIVADYLPARGRILDLGGGGFRFALPVALLGRSLMVVDPDPRSVDLESIVSRVNANDGSRLVSRELAHLIDVRVVDGFDFLAEQREEFSLITAFRVAHLFSPDQIDRFFSLTATALEPGGHLAVSGMTAHNLTTHDEMEHNEVFENSEPIELGQPLYRHFLDTPQAAEVRRAQNLSARFHLFDSEFVAELAGAHDLDLVVDAHKSTRIVAGYVLRKRQGS